MKRFSIVFLVLIIILSVASCSQIAKETEIKDEYNDFKVTLKAKIIDINGSTMLVANMVKDAGPADIYHADADKADIKAADGSDANIADLKTGMLVDVVFDGTIMESYPMKLGAIKSISIISQGEDIAGLYKKVADDLYSVDPGLNDNINILAFDFTKVTNLTEPEKSALIYLIGDVYKIHTVAATYEELCEQGYIDKDKLYFEKGLLFTIEDTVMSGGSFTFDAKKWRSGLGAYFFYECTARKTEDGWSYSIGAEMIS